MDVQCSDLSDRELMRLHRQVYRRFYLRPWRLWRILRLLPHKRQLLQLVSFFLSRSFAVFMHHKKVVPIQDGDARPAPQAAGP